jgi:hypothetical protein
VNESPDDPNEIKTKPTVWQDFFCMGRTSLLTLSKSMRRIGRTSQRSRNARKIQDDRETVE